MSTEGAGCSPPIQLGLPHEAAASYTEDSPSRGIFSDGTRVEIPSGYFPGTFIPFSFFPLGLDANTQVQTHQLCVKCSDFRNIFHKRDELDYSLDDFEYMGSGIELPSKKSVKIRHYENTHEIKGSAAAGCHLCSLLVSCIFGPGHNSANELYPCRVFLIQSDVVPEYWLVPSIGPDASQLIIGLKISETLTDYCSPKSSPLTTASEDSYSWARSQMKQCLSSCVSCNSLPLDSSFLPTRLLDIGSVKAEGRIRLICPADIGLSSVRYITLSYCWGADQPVKLIRDTFTAFASGIDIESLPKTHRDAIRICQWFDQRYLWIDALCILQDDDKDWHREASHMGSIYENSYLTIAALKARQSGQGCFAIRNPLMLQPCILSAESGDKGHSITPLSDFRPTDRRFEQAELFMRGWALQERILSPRTLCFGEQLFWECSGRLTSEFGFFALNIDRIKLKSLMPSVSGRWPENPTPFTKEPWSEIIESYTRATLTYQSDRLPAITGIIEAIGKRTGLRNLAGFWVPIDTWRLLWYSTSKTGGVNKQAPTWSWLHLYESINWYQSRQSSKGCEQVATIHHMSVGDLSRDFDSVPQDVWIHFRGPLCEIEAMKVRDGGHPNRPKVLTWDWHDVETVLDHFHHQIGRIHVDYWPIDQDTFTSQNYKMVEDRSRPLSCADKRAAFSRLYFLPFWFQKGRENSTQEGRCAGLLLKPVNVGGKFFQRVGVMEMWSLGLQTSGFPRHQDNVILV